MKKRAKFSDELRAAVKASGHSGNTISRETGIDRGAFSRFINGKMGFSLDTIDVLAEFLDLHVVGPKPVKAKRTKRPAKKSASKKRKG